MAEKLNERQQGIQDFRDLFRKYNGLIAGDKGLRKAYRNFLKRNKLDVEQPTQTQRDYVKILNTSAPLMETTIEGIKQRRGD